MTLLRRSGLPDWPRDVAQALTVFAEQQQALRCVVLQAVYIHGSLVLEDYRPGRSDIDFVGVTGGTFTQAGVAELKRLHLALRIRFPWLRFHGSYVPSSASTAGALSRDPGLFIDGGLAGSARTGSWNEVTRYELATRAVPLIGPPGSTFVGAPDPAALLTYVRQNMNDYWVNWVNQVGGSRPIDVIAATLLARKIEWGVLGVSRQFYTLRERDVISKAGAGEYMMKLTPAEYQRILAEALDHRFGLPTSRYANWRVRRCDALAYMRWVIGEANGAASPQEAVEKSSVHSSTRQRIIMVRKRDL